MKGRMSSKREAMAWKPGCLLLCSPCSHSLQHGSKTADVWTSIDNTVCSSSKQQQVLLKSPCLPFHFVLYFLKSSNVDSIRSLECHSSLGICGRRVCLTSFELGLEIRKGKDMTLVTLRQRLKYLGMLYIYICIYIYIYLFLLYFSLQYCIGFAIH